MTEELRIDPEALMDEIARYLGVVDAFRAVDSEPSWRPEPVLAFVRLDPPVPAAASRVVH